MIINKNVARLTPRNEDYSARGAVLSLRTRFKKLTHFNNGRPNALLEIRPNEIGRGISQGKIASPT